MRDRNTLIRDGMDRAVRSEGSSVLGDKSELHEHLEDRGWESSGEHWGEDKDQVRQL
jgi:hypothetical protein